MAEKQKKTTNICWAPTVHQAFHQALWCVQGHGSHSPTCREGKVQWGRKGLCNEAGIQESRQTLEMSPSRIPAMESSGIREVGDNFWLGWSGVAFWRRETLKGLSLSPSVTMTVTTSCAPVLLFMFHMALYSPQRSKVSFILQTGERGFREVKERARGHTAEETSWARIWVYAFSTMPCCQDNASTK